MVAYSFKVRFRPPILRGLKRHTIRGGRKRHARPGDMVQLYTGMRTRFCAIIGTAICVGAPDIVIDLKRNQIELPQTAVLLTKQTDLDAFAVSDGFENWDDMEAFWRREHPETLEFHGVMIRWAAFVAGPAAARGEPGA